MIQLAVCNAANCPNKGIVYRIEDCGLTVECGGCKATLTPTPEEAQ